MLETAGLERQVSKLPLEEKIYQDYNLSRRHHKILAALLGKEMSGNDLVKAKVMGNRNTVYQTLKELASMGLIVRREDPSKPRQILYTALLYTPVPKFSGWQRYLLEPQLTKYRNAAKLGLHLYYYCVEGKKGHAQQSLLLADDLGIKDFVSGVMNASESGGIRESINALRRVNVRLRDHHDKIVASAFAITSWTSISARLLKDSGVDLESTNPTKRITDELRILTGEQPVVDYARDSLEAWFRRGELTDSNPKQRVTRNGETFFQILNLYVTSYGGQHTQSELLQNFFDKRISIADHGFEAAVKPILAHNVGTLTVVSGSGAFKGISRKRKRIRVKSGERISGAIKLEARVESPEPNVVPLVEVRTWLRREVENEGWVEAVPNIKKRFETHALPDPNTNKDELTIDCNGPVEKGIHYLIFAFGEETECQFLASKTIWTMGYPIWNDDCDLADFKNNPEIIELIQKNGHVETEWLREHGYGWTEIAADAIIVEAL